MNTKLVKSLVQAIQSLSLEERNLLEKELFFNDSEPSTVELMQIVQASNSLDFLETEPDIYSLEDGEPINVS